MPTIFREPRVRACFGGLVLCLGLETAPAAPVARWSFDAAAPDGTIPADAGDVVARLESASGQAGLGRQDERSVFRVPGTDARDCLTLGEGPAFDLPKAFTLEAWFRPEPAAPGSYVMILGKRYSNQYQLTWTPNGDNTIEFYVGGGDLMRNRCWQDHLPTGRWLHVVAAYDSAVTAGPTQWLYVNGELARAVRNEVRLTSDLSALRLAQNSIMGLTGGVPAAWDEVAIYDHALTAAEVAAAYAAKAPRGAGETVDHWALDGGLERWTWLGGSAGGGVVRDGMSGVAQREHGATVGSAGLTGGSGDWRFGLVGEPPQSVAGAWRRPLEPALRGPAIRALHLRYRSRGLQRSAPPLRVLSLESDQGAIPLLTSSHLLLDGRPHDLLATVALRGTCDALRVELRCQGSSAELAIEQLELLPELLPPAATAAAALAEGLEAIALTASARCHLRTVFEAALAGNGGAVQHALRDLPADGCMTLDGLPFRGPADGAALWVADTATPRNEAEIEALGTTIKRGSFLPIGRDDPIGIDVGRQVSELYLLLVTDLPALQNQYCQPTLPCVVRDVEAFAVDLVYADGTRDTVFPWSARDAGYRIVGMAGGYVVAADRDRPLQRLVLHNRMYGRTIGVAGVTLNRGVPRFPQLAAEPPLPAPPPARAVPEGNRVSLDAGLARVSHGAGTLVLDCRDGFAIRELRYEAATGASMWPAPGSGIDVRVAGRWFSGTDFRVVAMASSAEDTLVVRLAGRTAALPLDVELTFRAEGAAGIVASITATNTGPADVRADLRFPSLKRFSLGAPEDTWLFFPQYRNVLTNRPVFCKQPNHRGFLVQFMDVFSPAAGGGLGLLTRNPAQEPVQYALAKGPDGVSAYIENEGEDFALAPGVSRRFCDRVLVFHAGDWHAAAAAYRDWVSDWYRPVHSQDKPWFRQAAWIRSHITSASIARQIAHTPPLYDAANRRWRLAEFLAADQALLGCDPDLIHFYVWAFDESRPGDQARNGDYGGRDYDNLGGLDSFRKALAELRGPLHKPVSLYTIWDRYTPGTEFHRQFGDRPARVTAGGQRLASEDMITISPGVPAWRTYARQTLRRLQRETAADILYLDVFGTDDRARDFSPDSGHPHVPNWVAEDDGRFLAGLREDLPAEVVLWGEFPVPDVASQYWDGFLSYDCIALHSYLAEALDGHEEATGWGEHALPPNVVRSLFPHLRQVVFPVGTEGSISNWRYLKFLLFNGQALFDTTWRLYDETCREQLGRVIGLEHTYADCFDSERPEVLVPTLRLHVFANRFPGKGRTLWTLFNGRYRTVRGEVLRVPHVSGARYRDVWNGTDLTPRISAGEATIALDLPPQGIGCIVQARE